MLPRDGGAVVAGAQVVLHIARPKVLVALPGLGTRKLAEDLLHGLAHHIRQDIQPPCRSESMSGCRHFAVHAVLLKRSFTFEHNLAAPSGKLLHWHQVDQHIQARCKNESVTLQASGCA